MFAELHGAGWLGLTRESARRGATWRLLLAALLTFASLPVLATPNTSKNLTVRIAVSSGVPRLMVNGQPVRPRMFFGGPGSSPIKVEPAGRLVEFEFIAQEDAADTGTLHFRFGHTAGDVFLDNIRVVDVASGKDVAPLANFESGPDSFSRDWTFWPPGPANTVGKVTVEPSVGAADTAGLHVKLRQPPGGQWPDFHIYHLPNLAIVRGRHYRVTFWARAEPARELTVALYRPGDPFICLGGPPGPFQAQIRMAAAVGVDFVTFPDRHALAGAGGTRELAGRGQRLRASPGRQPASPPPAALRRRPAGLVAQGAPG